MAVIIEETSTVTSKGQTTVPKSVRQALGVGAGGRIAFRVENGQVTLHNPEAEGRDPALAAFLALIENDIRAGRNTGDLPEGLLRALARNDLDVEVDLCETLEGDIEL